MNHISRGTEDFFSAKIGFIQPSEYDFKNQINLSQSDQSS